MRKGPGILVLLLVLLLALGLILAPALSSADKGGSKQNGCPHDRNPAGPPNCGSKQGGGTTCTLGTVTAGIDAQDFGSLDSTVHGVLCGLAGAGITF
jgi:hypothetical protein